MPAPSRKATRTKGIAEALDEALGYIAQGHTQTRACDMAGIAVLTMIRYRERDEAFRLRWEAAKVSQAEYWRDRIIQVADEEEDVQRARLKQDALKWVLAKTRPLEYGDRTQIEHSGPGGAAMEHKITVELVPSVAPVRAAQPAQIGGDQTWDGETQ